MGVFLHTVLFPGGDELKCRTALQRSAADPQLSISLDGCRWHLYPKGPGVLLNDGCCGYEALAEKLSGGLSCPVLVLYIYDDDYWGYFLYEAGTEQDRFASLPDYFEPGSPPRKPGNAPLLSQIFGVGESALTPYLLPWPEEETEGFAREGDSAPIGDCWQMADFMAALGFDYDLLCPPAPKPQPEPLSPPPAPVPPQPRRSYGGHGTPVDTPTLPDALNNRAYALQRGEAVRDIAGEAVELMRQMHYQKALPLLTAALSSHPDRAELYLLRAFCWSQLEGLMTGMSRKPDMDRDLGKVLELEPDNVMALRARCPTAGTTTRYQRHILELTRLMALDEENRDLYLVSRAYRYHWVGDDASARADLRAVLDRKRLWTVDLVYLCKELGLPGF